MTRRRRTRARVPLDLRAGALMARDTVVILRDAILIILGVVLTIDTFVIEEGAVDPVRAAACATLLGLPIFLRSEDRDSPPPPTVMGPPPSPSSTDARPELGPVREDPRT